MKVELVGFSPDPEKVPGMAAMLTHSEKSASELLECSDENLSKVLSHVLAVGHTSVIEHATFTFAISGVSRSLTHQLVRHRLASYAQQSQRYVNLVEPCFVTPPKIEKDPKLKEAYVKSMQAIWKQYNELLELGIPAEDARYVLPNACCTNILVTMNARSLLNFFELRCCLHAQWEIRMLAQKMLALVKDVAPVLFKSAGPPCKSKGFCPEKKKDCPLYPKS